MNLSDIEKKFLMLAMDKAAREPEMASAAKKFFQSMRKRYPSGVELIKALEGGLLAPPPFPSMTRPFSASAPQYQQAANAWGDIMREAQRMGAQRAAAAQAQRQHTWEEWCASHGFNPYQNAYRPENMHAQQAPKTGGVVPPKDAPKKDEGIVEKIKKMFSP
jgi:hypothetical protein